MDKGDDVVVVVVWYGVVAMSNVQIPLSCFWLDRSLDMYHMIDIYPLANTYQPTGPEPPSRLYGKRFLKNCLVICVLRIWSLYHGLIRE